QPGLRGSSITKPTRPRCFVTMDRAGTAWRARAGLPIMAWCRTSISRTPARQARLHRAKPESTPKPTRRSTRRTTRVLKRHWAPGSGAFDARTKIGVGADSGFSLAFGLHIGDSGNSNRLLLQLAVDTTNHNWSVAAYTYASGSYTARGGSWTGIGNALYLRVK